MQVDEVRVGLVGLVGICAKGRSWGEPKSRQPACSQRYPFSFSMSFISSPRFSARFCSSSSFLQKQKRHPSLWNVMQSTISLSLSLPGSLCPQKKERRTSRRAQSVFSSLAHHFPHHRLRSVLHSHWRSTRPHCSSSSAQLLRNDLWVSSMSLLPSFPARFMSPSVGNLPLDTLVSFLSPRLQVVVTVGSMAAFILRVSDTEMREREQ